MMGKSSSESQVPTVEQAIDQAIALEHEARRFTAAGRRPLRTILLSLPCGRNMLMKSGIMLNC